MKRVIRVALAVAGFVLLVVLPAFAWHGGHFGTSIRIGPGGWPAYPYWYYGPPAVVRQPVITREAPVEYIEPSQSPEPEYYWYFCPDAKGYYPYVKECPNGWTQVVPSPDRPEKED